MRSELYVGLGCLLLVGCGGAEEVDVPTPSDIITPSVDTTPPVEDVSADSVTTEDADKEISVGECIPAECDDDDPCNGTETCNQRTGACDPGVAVICDDGDGCNGLETCDLNTGECVPGNTMVCDDGEACNGEESCDSQSGECVPGTAVACDDGDACNGTETCNNTDGSCVAGTAVECLDNDACDGLDTCDKQTGDCVTGLPMDCNDAVDCTVDSCLGGVCINDASAAGCDDNDLCTQDACDAIQGCIHTAKDCDDNDLCTTDSCEPLTGQCANPSVDCDDGQPCNGAESCNAGTGACAAGSPVQCDDSNACNGLESCDENTGKCVSTPSIDCSDGNLCNGDEICMTGNGQCKPASAPLCPEAPPQCNQTGGDWSPTTNKITNTGTLGFRLTDDQNWDSYDAIWTDIENHSSTTKATLATVMGDLNRTGSAKTTSLIDCFHSAFYWNDGDNNVDYWMPQGVTGSADASQTGPGWSGGKFNGKKIMLVSWYHKAEEDSSTSQYKGVRISFVDHTGSTPKYRHALLVEPFVSAAGDSFRPLSSATSSLHAGGIVWYKNYLYVADTSNGLRVFDLSRMLKVDTGQKSLAGYDANAKKFYAYNYRYVIPQMGSYSLCPGNNCCARFSFVAADLSYQPDSLLTGEYVKDDTTGRLMRWPLDETTGRLQVIDGGVKCSQALYGGVKKMQGAASVGGHYYISSSVTESVIPPVMDTLYDGVPGQTVKAHEYPYGPEDLYYSKWSGLLWTCTEHPETLLNKRRFCMSVKVSNVNSGCN